MYVKSFYIHTKMAYIFYVKIANVIVLYWHWCLPKVWCCDLFKMQLLANCSINYSCNYNLFVWFQARTRLLPSRVFITSQSWFTRYAFKEWHDSTKKLVCKIACKFSSCPARGMNSWFVYNFFLILQQRHE
jgi:hypothetical protein